MKISKIRRFRWGYALLAVILALSASFLPACLSSKQSSRRWAIQVIENNYYQEIDANFDGLTVPEIVSTYLDQYSAYYTAEEYQQMLTSDAGGQVGIGIRYEGDAQGKPLIVEVMGNSPAWESGLRAGEVILGGKVGTEEKVTFETKDDFKDFTSLIGVNQTFTLYGEGEATYTLAKREYQASYAYLCTNQTAWTVAYNEQGQSYLLESPDDKITYLPDGAGYIKLLEFYGNAGKEFADLMEKFNAMQCTSLYFDLRNNGGGFVYIMQQIAGCFAPAESVAMSAVYRSGNRETFPVYEVSQNAVIPQNTPIYMLANSGSASASEALIGVLVSNNRLPYQNIYLSAYGDAYNAHVEGSSLAGKSGKSYGKGIMQSTFTNWFTGEALKLTTAKIYWPNGATIHDVGLSQSLGCKTVEAAWSVTKADEELQRVVTATTAVAAPQE